jgi:DNA-3-methyladenine glycosylase II
MKKPFFWEKAKKVLISKDKKLGKIISNYPKDFLFSKSDPFYTLARSIVGQQISVKAAQAVWDKIENKAKCIEPNYISKMHFMSLKSCGLSRQKIKYLKSLSSAFIQNKISPEKWKKYSDEDIINELVLIKGIGRWTAEMFLIFTMGRIDVFSNKDIGLLNAIKIIYNFEVRPNFDEADKLAKRWSPYRTIASLYLWKILEGEDFDW